jgi:hypothetical protein
MASLELELRKGEANDAVRDLQTHINFKLGLQAEKRKHARYTLDTTRAAKIIRDAEKGRDAAAETYRAAREAIISLGGDGEKEYPTLSEQDLVAKSIANGSVLGGGKVTESWLFSEGAPVNGSKKQVSEWEEESECIRARSIRNCL